REASRHVLVHVPEQRAPPETRKVRLAIRGPRCGTRGRCPGGVPLLLCDDRRRQGRRCDTDPEDRREKTEVREACCSGWPVDVWLLISDFCLHTCLSPACMILAVA